jgi:hypothetical protein
MRTDSSCDWLRAPPAASRRCAQGGPQRAKRFGRHLGLVMVGVTFLLYPGGIIIDGQAVAYQHAGIIRAQDFMQDIASPAPADEIKGRFFVGENPQPPSRAAHPPAGLPAPSGRRPSGKGSALWRSHYRSVHRCGRLARGAVARRVLRIGAAVCRLSASGPGRVLRRSNAGRSNRRAPRRSCASRGLWPC